MKTVAASKIARLSQQLSLMALLMLILIVGLFSYVFVDADRIKALLTRQFLGDGASIAFDQISHVIIALAWLLPLAAVAYALLSANRLFRIYGRMEIFSLDASRCLVRIGISSISIVPLQMIASIVSRIVATRNAPPSGQQIAIAIDAPSLVVLVLGGLVWVVGWISAEATKLADDSRSII